MRPVCPLLLAWLVSTTTGLPARSDATFTTGSLRTNEHLMVRQAVRSAGNVNSRTVPPGNEVRFVVWGDSQFDVPPVFERLAYETNLLRPDFVVQVGDLITGYTDDSTQLWSEWVRFFQQIAPLDMAYYPVPGNHDVVTTESHKIYGRVWGADRYHYAFRNGPVMGIILNSFEPGSNDRISPRQMEWLRETLAKVDAETTSPANPDGPPQSIFVFLHSPLWRYEKEKPGRKDWDEIHGMLKSRPVRLVVAGHTHEQVHEVHDGIDYLVINSAGRMKWPENERGGFFHAMLHVSVRNGTDIRYAIIKSGSILPIDTIDQQDRAEKSLLSFPSSTIRIPGWKRGEPFDGQGVAQWENRSEEERDLEFEWRFPHGSEGVTVDPPRLRVTAQPKEVVETTFALRAERVPGPGAQPFLEVRESRVLPTRVVPRPEEARLRGLLDKFGPGGDGPVRIHRDGANPGQPAEAIVRPAIMLDAPTEFKARYDIVAPPEARAARREGPIAIDGRLDEAAWKSAQPITDFLRGDGTTPTVATEVRVLYDEGRLYVAARLGEPNPAGLKANAGGEIAMTWNDDDLELFFNPTNDLKDHTRLFINNAGTRFNAFPLFVKPSRYFKSKYESAITIDPDAWIVEMAIPYADIWPEAIAPKPGDHWTFNVGRHRQQEDGAARISWKGLGLYGIARYGVLKFE